MYSTLHIRQKQCRVNNWTATQPQTEPNSQLFSHLFSFVGLIFPRCALSDFNHQKTNNQTFSRLLWRRLNYWNIWSRRLNMYIKRIVKNVYDKSKIKISYTFWSLIIQKGECHIFIIRKQHNVSEKRIRVRRAKEAELLHSINEGCSIVTSLIEKLEKYRRINKVRSNYKEAQRNGMNHRIKLMNCNGTYRSVD